MLDRLKDLEAQSRRLDPGAVRMENQAAARQLA